GSFEGPERLEAIRNSLQQYQPFCKPEPAKEADLLLVHEERLVAKVKRRKALYEVILLAVGGAILSARLAMRGEPAFGLIRPPGHHADSRASWGFCYVNNMAIAIKKILTENNLNWVVVFDLDHHVGDGTQRIFLPSRQVTVINIIALNRQDYLAQTSNKLQLIRRADLLAISMGFDTYEHDIGGLLCTEDYAHIGSWFRRAAERLCQGRRFALLEGGYYLPDLGKNVLAFCEGFG
ncbi:MAG: histone deacetylase family protein, partial [Deltaproteobacteria bacterium]|nr:histone deacetylase family protein [Deltaproteobacteria bacterium]